MIINLDKNLELSTKLRVATYYLLVLIYYSADNVSHSSHIYILSTYSNSIYYVIFWEIIMSSHLSSVIIPLLLVLWCLLYYLLYLPVYYLLSYSVVFFIVFFNFVIRLHCLIKFEITWWLPLFGNNNAWCIWLTPVLIDFGLSFCFCKCLVRDLLGTI